jgi:hypothetical protein
LTCLGIADQCASDSECCSGRCMFGVCQCSLATFFCQTALDCCQGGSTACDPDSDLCRN